MRFLIDNALSPLLAEKLNDFGHDAVHVRDLDMQKSKDIEIFKKAQEQDRVLVSADTDFGEILAKRNDEKPSVILFRMLNPRKPVKQAELLSCNLKKIEKDLLGGAISVFEENRIRVRPLPINGKSKD